MRGWCPLCRRTMGVRGKGGKYRYRKHQDRRSGLPCKSVSKSVAADNLRPGREGA